MSIGDVDFINDSIEAAMNNILKVNFKKIDSLKEFYRDKDTERVTKGLQEAQWHYCRFYNSDSLEVIMAAEEIIKERRIAGSSKEAGKGFVELIV